MKRSLAVLAGLALAVAAAPAAAQAPYLDEFTYGGQYPNTPNPPISPYLGTLDNTPLNDNTVWCVDLSGTGNWSGEAWVTSMSQNDFSRTEAGNAGASSYRWAAYFASQMDWYDNPGAPDAYNTNLQYLIWNLLGYPHPNQSVAQANTFLANNFAGLGTVADLQATGPALDFFDYRRWVVITATGNANCTNNSSRDCQEYIGLRPGDPNEVVPEPATMTLLATGLAGMAAARRRRKQG